jgi:tetratricopeptide (TPR) repeat protein
MSVRMDTMSTKSTKKFVIPVLLFLFSFTPVAGRADDQAGQYLKDGISFYDQGDYNQAMTAFQKTVQEDPNYAEGYYNLGLLYDLQGNFAEAIKAYENTVRIDPNVGTVLKNLTQDYYAAGKLEEAMNSIKLAESRGEPVDKAFYNQMWAEYKGLKARGSATKKQIKQIKGKKLSPLSSAKAGEMEQVNKELELSINSLEKDLMQQESGKPGELISLGIKYRQKGEIDKSIDTLSKALQVSSGKMMIYAELGLCYYFKGQKSLFIQNFGQAKKSGFKPSQSLNDLYLRCLARK